MYQLSFSSYCPPGAFCEQTIVSNPPTTLQVHDDWDLLAKAEVSCVLAACLSVRTTVVMADVAGFEQHCCLGGRRSLACTALCRECVFLGGVNGKN